MKTTRQINLNQKPELAGRKIVQAVVDGKTDRVTQWTMAVSGTEKRGARTQTFDFEGESTVSQADAAKAAWAASKEWLTEKGEIVTMDSSHLSVTFES